MRAVAACLLLLSGLLPADEFDDILPPQPVFDIYHDAKSGDFIVSFQSDSNDPRDLMNPEINFLRPVWYLLETWDADLFGPGSGGWIRPFALIHAAPVNTTIQFRTNTKFHPLGLMRVIALWGA